MNCDGEQTIIGPNIIINLHNCDQFATSCNAAATHKYTT